MIAKPAVRRVIAVDLGANSCRVSLGTSLENGGGSIRMVHRFPNAPISRSGSLFWDLDMIEDNLHQALILCSEQVDGPIDSIGIDGWAVDYVRVGEDERPLDNPFCYRDLRTERRQLELWEKISKERIYSLTGIQHLRFNTLYQLYADRCDGLPSGKFWLNIPEYLLFRLGARPVAEYSNATHTQMVRAGKREWCDEIFAVAGLDAKQAPDLVPPGTVIGTLKGALANHKAFRNTKLIAPACHDTGSAVAGIPAGDDNWAFLSSGTWSILGAVLPEPCLSALAMQNNFSNEGGLEGCVRFLKNVNGMWLLQELLRYWNERSKNWSVDELAELSRSISPPEVLLDVDDPELLLPDDMPLSIDHVMVKNGGCPLNAQAYENAPAVASLVFHSLAARYAEVLNKLTQASGKQFDKLFVVGGGSKNELLNSYVAERTGLKVIRGPVECATFGNIAVQLATLDESSPNSSGVSHNSVALWSRHIFDSWSIH